MPFLFCDHCCVCSVFALSSYLLEIDLKFCKIESLGGPGELLEELWEPFWALGRALGAILDPRLSKVQKSLKQVASRTPPRDHFGSKKLRRTRLGLKLCSCLACFLEIRFFIDLM